MGITLTEALGAGTSGERIKLARTKAGVSQQDLADYTDMSCSQIQKLEQDVTPADKLAYERASAIADVLEVPVTWLASGDLTDVPLSADERGMLTDTLTEHGIRCDTVSMDGTLFVALVDSLGVGIMLPDPVEVAIYRGTYGDVKDSVSGMLDFYPAPPDDEDEIDEETWEIATLKHGIAEAVSDAADEWFRQIRADAE